jgi:hypothetical protein
LNWGKDHAKMLQGWLSGYFMSIELNNTAKKQLKRINEPYLSAIVAAIDKPLVIETNLTKAEKESIAEGRKERKEHPENFTAWTDVKKEIGLA